VPHSILDFERFSFRAVIYFMDDPRIVELLTEVLQELKQMNVRVERLEKQQQTTNLKLQELTLSNLKLADELHNIMQLGDRVTRLEAAPFH
jgi:ATP-dependent helicase/DNAse subunit B